MVSSKTRFRILNMVWKGLAYKKKTWFQIVEFALEVRDIETKSIGALTSFHGDNSQLGKYCGRDSFSQVSVVERTLGNVGLGLISSFGRLGRSNFIIPRMPSSQSSLLWGLMENCKGYVLVDKETHGPRLRTKEWVLTHPFREGLKSK